jgi:adenylate kinase
MYHIHFDPPKVEGVCDSCGGALYQRDDDKQETIVSRLKVYSEQTAPLIEYYGEQGSLVSISGTGEIDEIFKRIVDVLEK